MAPKNSKFPPPLLPLVLLFGQMARAREFDAPSLSGDPAAPRGGVHQVHGGAHVPLPRRRSARGGGHRCRWGQNSLSETNTFIFPTRWSCFFSLCPLQIPHPLPSRPVQGFDSVGENFRNSRKSFVSATIFAPLPGAHLLGVGPTPSLVPRGLKGSLTPYTVTSSSVFPTRRRLRGLLPPAPGMALDQAGQRLETDGVKLFCATMGKGHASFFSFSR